MTIKAVVLDVDNTLVSFLEIKRICVTGAAEAMIDAGLKGTMDSIVEKIYCLYWHYGIEDQSIFEKFLTQELGSVNYEILGCAIAEYRKRKATVMLTYPMVRKTLIELIRMGLKLGVLSDAPRIPLYTRIAELKLNKYFNVILTAEDVDNKKKPDPAPFLKICEKLEVTPQECIMVGDWEERDMVGAKNVGMITVFASYGDEWNTKQPKADYILKDNIWELIPIVNELISLKK